MMTFERLQDLLADWYEVPATELGLPESVIPDGINPILRDFYRRFGMLAERKSKFAHPDSNNLPLSCQDHIFSVDELKTEEEFTLFGAENQGNFVVAASKDPLITTTFAKGDFSQHRNEVLTDVGVPLHECLITCVLRETILSVSDRYRRITPADLDEDRKAAQTGETVVSRYVWPDSYCTFHLSKSVWFMDWDGPHFSAHRGLWRQKPSTWQEQIFENGGSWSSGPSNPTLVQKIERFVTRFGKK